jgi:hypothetical protein
MTCKVDDEKEPFSSSFLWIFNMSFLHRPAIVQNRVKWMMKKMFDQVSVLRDISIVGCLHKSRIK